MRIKLVVLIVLILATASAVIIAFSATDSGIVSTVEAARDKPKTKKPIAPTKATEDSTKKISAGTSVDVPDDVAYLVVFRMLSSHTNEMKKRQLRGYIEQNLGVTEDGDIEAVFDLADKFKTLIAPIDEEIRSIKESYHPNHYALSQADLNKLKNLDKAKYKVVKDLIKEIPNRLTESSKMSLEHKVEWKIKKKIKRHERQ